MNAKFIDALDESLQSDEIYHTKDSATLRSVAITEGVSLQSIVLDKALQTVSDKYKKHLKIIRPALDQLLKMVEENHEASGLKELLAVKKSLSQFEHNIQNVKTEINLFSKELSNESYHEDLQGIFEYFNHNIQEVEFDIKKLIGMIEDCEQFVSIHLDTVR